MVRGRMVGRINFVRIVAASIQPVDIVIAEVCHHLQQLWILSKKVIPHILSALRFEVLIFAVHSGIHRTLHQALTVFGKQRIPMPAPDDFDDVPASTPEVSF